MLPTETFSKLDDHEDHDCVEQDFSRHKIVVPSLCNISKKLGLLLCHTLKRTHTLMEGIF